MNIHCLIFVIRLSLCMLHEEGVSSTYPILVKKVPFEMRPQISIVLPTYNRPQLLKKAVESILIQTFDDFELIIINNGSEKETAEVLANFTQDSRIKIISLEKNVGFASACNLGFDLVQGVWFTIMSDDDSLLPHALERLMSVPERIDPKINAVSCNCFSSINNQFTGKGLPQTGYVEAKDIILSCVGEFWGITRTDLLGDRRFNPKLSDDVNHLWYQIDIIANRYYLHEGLKMYDDGVGGRLSSPSRFRLPRSRAEHYKNLYQESAYWEILSEYAPERYKSRLIKACIVLDLVNEREALLNYQSLLQSQKLNLKEQFLMSLIRNLPRPMARSLYTMIPV